MPDNNEPRSINIDVSDADFIFIPSDIEGEKSDFFEFKAKIYRSILPNCILVKRNRFTKNLRIANEIEKEAEYENGKIKEYPKYKTGGIHFSFPLLTETIVVPIIDRTIDYPKAKYYTKDGIELTIDMALKVRIVDPINYLKFGRFQLDQLDILTKNLLIEYVKRKNYLGNVDIISSGRVELEEFAPLTRYEYDEEGNVINTITKDESAYEDFRKRYGIEIKSVQIKEIRPSEEVQKMLDDEAQAKLKQRAKIIELETRKNEAEREAEIAAIRGKGTAEEFRLVEQAKIDILEKMYAILDDDSITNNQKVSILQQMLAGKNGIYIGGNNNGNSLENNITQGIVKGSIVSDKIKSRNTSETDTNVEKLIATITTYMHVGIIEETEEINTIIENLKTDQAIIKEINELDEESFKLCMDKILSPYMTNSHTRNLGRRS